MNVILLFFLFVCFIIGIVFSKISIQLQITQELNKNKKVTDFAIIIKLYWFHIIKILQITINRKKSGNKKKKNKFKINKEIITLIKKSDYKIEKLDLQANIGTENVIFTSLLTVILSTIISNILVKFSKIINKQHCKYNIHPLYNSVNTINFKLNCIISSNFVNIIIVAYKILMKERNEKNERRTSNRRAYGYGNE